MNKEKKALLLDYFGSVLSGDVAIVYCNYSGITVKEVDELRRRAWDRGINVKVIKNTLFKRAGKSTMHEIAVPYMKGQIVAIYGDDIIACSRLVSDFATEYVGKLPVVVASFSGQVLTSDEVKFYAKLPSLPEVRARFLGVCLAPATKLVSLNKEPARYLLRALNAKVDSAQ